MTRAGMTPDEPGKAKDVFWDLNGESAPDSFRAAMRRVVGGVAVVATLHDQRPWGMTVSAYAPVCMEPPTLVVCVNAATTTAADIQSERLFSLNLLSESQLLVSQRCAQAGASKYLDGDVVPQDRLPRRIAMPVLRDCVATFECFATEIRNVGTHVVVMGAVRAIVAPQARRPLLYGQGSYLVSVALDAAFAPVVPA
jgi:flavin reductase (DIM6/NTAB) family NADH-FMN oxidoreductase RutF